MGIDGAWFLKFGVEQMGEYGYPLLNGLLKL
ncbi:hypothetical protein Nhal_0630 [Nitrosococcus halophilus Nc 4]|uniref:Uncharacterized protein n=1 Tax=Nitrosococcus halophilus (strain Nc4) TaxID=472759 RepID=D5BWT1_NITHN|nr:hypothetical protein Nhal_0630 [Nitrosococcus halophilus Nc 4]